MSFKIGDIIRNKKPYFLESTRKVVALDTKRFPQFYTVMGPGKYGLWADPRYRQIHFDSEVKHFRIAGRIERAYLFCFGCFSIAWDKVVHYFTED